MPSREVVRELEALARHIRLFVGDSTGPRPPENKNSPVSIKRSERDGEREAVLRWFSSLPTAERPLVVATTEREWCVLVAAMAARSRVVRPPPGHGLRFSPSPPPFPAVAASCASLSQRASLVERRQLAALAAAAARRSRASYAASWVPLRLCGTPEEQRASRDIEAVAVAHGDRLQLVTFSEAFLADTTGFVAAMDGVSRGGFLRQPPKGKGSSSRSGTARKPASPPSVWQQVWWLAPGTDCSLGAYLASRLELALLTAFRGALGKAGNLPVPGPALAGGDAVAASALQELRRRRKPVEVCVAELASRSRTAAMLQLGASARVAQEGKAVPRKGNCNSSSSSGSAPCQQPKPTKLGSGAVIPAAAAAAAVLRLPHAALELALYKGGDLEPGGLDWVPGAAPDALIALKAAVVLLGDARKTSKAHLLGLSERGTALLCEGDGSGLPRAERLLLTPLAQCGDISDLFRQEFCGRLEEQYALRLAEQLVRDAEDTAEEAPPVEPISRALAVGKGKRAKKRRGSTGKAAAAADPTADCKAAAGEIVGNPAIPEQGAEPPPSDDAAKLATVVASEPELDTWGAKGVLLRAVSDITESTPLVVAAAVESEALEEAQWQCKASRRSRRRRKAAGTAADPAATRAKPAGTLGAGAASKTNSSETSVPSVHRHSLRDAAAELAAKPAPGRVEAAADSGGSGGRTSRTVIAASASTSAAGGAPVVAVGDGDERMSTSSFDSTDVRLDDQDSSDLSSLAHGAGYLATLTINWGFPNGEASGGGESGTSEASAAAGHLTPVWRWAGRNKHRRLAAGQPENATAMVATATAATAAAGLALSSVLPSLSPLDETDLPQGSAGSCCSSDSSAVAAPGPASSSSGPFASTATGLWGAHGGFTSTFFGGAGLFSWAPPELPAKRQWSSRTHEESDGRWWAAGGADLSPCAASPPLPSTFASVGNLPGKHAVASGTPLAPEPEDAASTGDVPMAGPRAAARTGLKGARLPAVVVTMHTGGSALAAGAEAVGGEGLVSNAPPSNLQSSAFSLNGGAAGLADSAESITTAAAGGGTERNGDSKAGVASCAAEEAKATAPVEACCCACHKPPKELPIAAADQKDVYGSAERFPLPEKTLPTGRTAASSPARTSTPSPPPSRPFAASPDSGGQPGQLPADPSQQQAPAATIPRVDETPAKSASLGGSSALTSKVCDRNGSDSHSMPLKSATQRRPGSLSLDEAVIFGGSDEVSPPLAVILAGFTETELSPAGQPRITAAAVGRLPPRPPSHGPHAALHAARQPSPGGPCPSTGILRTPERRHDALAAGAALAAVPAATLSPNSISPCGVKDAPPLVLEGGSPLSRHAAAGKPENSASPAVAAASCSVALILSPAKGCGQAAAGRSVRTASCSGSNGVGDDPSGNDDAASSMAGVCRRPSTTSEPGAPRPLRAGERSESADWHGAAAGRHMLPASQVLVRRNSIDGTGGDAAAREEMRLASFAVATNGIAGKPSAIPPPGPVLARAASFEAGKSASGGLGGESPYGKLSAARRPVPRSIESPGGAGKGTNVTAALAVTEAQLQLGRNIDSCIPSGSDLPQGAANNAAAVFGSGAGSPAGHGRGESFGGSHTSQNGGQEGAYGWGCFGGQHSVHAPSEGSSDWDGCGASGCGNSAGRAAGGGACGGNGGADGGGNEECDGWGCGGNGDEGCSPPAPGGQEGGQMAQDGLLLRDLCLRLEAEVAKLRNIVACQAGCAQTAPAPPGAGVAPAGVATGSYAAAAVVAAAAAATAVAAVPRLSSLVIPEHRHVAWEAMSDDGQGLVTWQRNGLLTSGGCGGGGGGNGCNGMGSLAPFRATAPPFIPEQFPTSVSESGRQGPGSLHGYPRQQNNAARVSPSPSPPLPQLPPPGSGPGGGGAGSLARPTSPNPAGAGASGGGWVSALAPAAAEEEIYRPLRERLAQPALSLASGFGLPGGGGSSGGVVAGRNGGRPTSAYGGAASCGGGSLRGPEPPLRSRLCEDLSTFLAYVTAQEQLRFEAKVAAFARCKAVVRGLWPRAQVQLYGSFVSGLSLPWSDLDLVICLPKVRKDAPAVTPGPLEGRNAIKETWQQELARSLASARWVDRESIRIISHTAVPVIKLTTQAQGTSAANDVSHAPPQLQAPMPLQLAAAHSALVEGPAVGRVAVDQPVSPLSPPEGRSQCVGAKGGFRYGVPLEETLPALPVPGLGVGYLPVCIDVSFEGNGHNGQAANRLVRSLVDELPGLRPLVLVLKQFLKDRGLCESYTGGLSSYALVLMAARYLQEQSWQMDTGSLLMGFLDFYGNHFDPRTTGISVARRCFFSRVTSGPAGASTGPAVRAGTGGMMASPAALFYSQTAMQSHTHAMQAAARRHSFVNGRGGAGASTSSIPGGSANGGPHAAATATPWGGDTARVPYRFDPLFVEDPLCEGNNVGRNCFRVYQIQRAWGDALAALTAALEDTGLRRSQLLGCIIALPIT